MEVVINIPEEVYKSIRDNNYCGIINSDVYNAIANGTPLPKGHGRIIAEPTEGDIAKTIGGQNDFAECIREAVKAVFDNAPTIIEADKEEADGDSN